MDANVDLLRVVIADGEPISRTALQTFLEGAPFQVVGVHDSAASCLRDTDTDVDIAVIGRYLRDLSVLELITALRQRPAKPRILVVAAWEGPEEVVSWLRAGASGYLLKSTTARELRVAAEAVAHRETVFSDEIAAELIQVAITPTEVDGSSAIDLTLTARENEVLRLVATGKDNAEIAGELFVSRYTVKNHVARILEKLGLENRVQAAVHASQLGAVADRV